MTKYALDLFAGTGSATQAFRESDDWVVISVDDDTALEENDHSNKESFEADIQKDITELTPEDFEEWDFDFIWASPPCTDFSIAGVGNTWADDRMPKRKSVPESVQVIYHTIWLINELDPEYWFMENPRGMMRVVMPYSYRDRESEVPEWAKPKTVTYCQYGNDFQKPTDLWGVHPPSFEHKTCSPGDDCHKESGRSIDSFKKHIRDPVERSAVPDQLSEEVFEAVENPGTKTKQETLA